MKILEQVDSGTCQKTLKIEVPREEITEQLDSVYKEFTSYAQIPGFRPGKAPRQIVQMKYGKHLKGEAVSKAIEDSYQKALEELDLHAVSQPVISDLEKDNEDQPITYTVKFEYVPEIELGEYKDIHPEPISTEVAEKDVVETLNGFRERNATFLPIEDRGIAAGDIVALSSQATIDGQPFEEATHKEITVEMGSGKYIAGFEDQLTGLKTDEEKTFQLTLPLDYPNEEKRGKEAVFTVVIKKIQVKQLPELDDEFAKDMGDFDDLDGLKERIRENLKQNYEQRKEQQLREDIRQELLKRNNFTVPPSMIQARYNYINALQDMEYRRYGWSLEGAIKEDQSLLARNEKAAEEEVRLTLIFEQIAKAENIELSDNEYYQYVAQMAKNSGSSPQVFFERIEKQGIEAYYRRVALEEKVLSVLQARIQDTDALAVSENTSEASLPSSDDSAAAEDKTTAKKTPAKKSSAKKSENSSETEAE